MLYGWYDENWWKVEDKTLTCSVADRENVIGPALSPLKDEFISDCSKTADSGAVSFSYFNKTVLKVQTA